MVKEEKECKDDKIATSLPSGGETFKLGFEMRVEEFMKKHEVLAEEANPMGRSTALSQGGNWMEESLGNLTASK